MHSTGCSQRSPRTGTTSLPTRAPLAIRRAISTWIANKTRLRKRQRARSLLNLGISSPSFLSQATEKEVSFTNLGVFKGTLDAPPANVHGGLKKTKK